jgi:uncharacterized protein (TIGR02246 family)
LLAAGRPSAADEAAAAKELDAVIAKYVAAYNAGSVNTVMDFWAENADFVDIRGRFHEGRDLIAALFRRGFASNPGRKMQVTLSARKFLAPEVAMDDGILELVAPDGTKERGRLSVVWTKVNGNWLIRSARDIPLEEEEEPAAEPQPPPMEQLSWLVGRWEAKGGKHQITLDCDWTLGKSFLVQTFKVKSEEDDFQVVTYLGYDPSEGRFRSWYFDSRGGFGHGPWIKRDSTWKGAMVVVMPDGEVGSSFFTWEQVDENTALWRAIDREIAGEPMPDWEQTYVRVKQPAAAPAARPAGAPAPKPAAKP